MNPEPIGFHFVHGGDVDLSFGGTEASIEIGRTALFFTNRPLAPGEKLVLSVNDRVTLSVVRIGFTEKDPLTLERPFPKMLPYGFDEKTGFWGPVCGDGGWIKGGTESLIHLEESTDRILIEKKGFAQREVFTGFRAKHPVYVVFNPWLGAPRVCIRSGKDYKSQPTPNNLEPILLRVDGFGRIKHRFRSESTGVPSQSEASPVARLRRADSHPQSESVNLGTFLSHIERPRQIELSGSRPIHPGTFLCPGESKTFKNFVLRPARATFSGPAEADSPPDRPVVNQTSSRRGNFVFIETPLRANRALFVKLAVLKRARPVQIVLTVENADRVYSCGSLLELCNATYSVSMESEIPETGDELAVGISPSGAVHISHNNRGWIEKMHVDKNLKYHVVFDMEHVSLLSMIGITNGFRDIGGSPPTPSQQPQNEASSECVVCFENQRNVLIVPCHHVALCEDCAGILSQTDEPECPICRGIITNTIKLYFA